MTLDEAITHAKEVADDMRQQIVAEPNEVIRQKCVECIDEHEQIAEWLEELKQYRAIGTVEELKDKSNCKDCAGCTLWKCDCANERAKAIDDFAEKLSLEISESIIWGMLSIDCKDGVSDEIVDYVIDTTKKIAEQLKGE